jgi:hypothetical protein
MEKGTETSNNAGSRGKFRIPWWFYLLSAVSSYCILQYLLPSIYSSQPELSGFVHLAKKAAPIIAIAFLLPAAHALYQNDKPTQPSSDTTVK